MKRSHPLLCLALAAPLLLAACAQTQERERPTLEELLEQRNLQLGESVERIPLFRASGWNDIDREHVILHSGANRRYLLTLMTPCLDLDFADRIGVNTSVSNTLTRFDSLVVERPSTTGTHNCPIREIHELERLGDEAEDQAGDAEEE